MGVFCHVQAVHDAEEVEKTKFSVVLFAGIRRKMLQISECKGELLHIILPVIKTVGHTQGAYAVDSARYLYYVYSRLLRVAASNRKGL